MRERAYARHIEQYTKSSILWPTASQHIDISLTYEPYVFHIVVKKSNGTYTLSSNLSTFLSHAMLATGVS